MDINIKNNQDSTIEVIQDDVRKRTVDRLLVIRKNLNMTQADISEKTGLKCSNISRLENGKSNFSLDMIVRIADAMGYDVDVQFHKRKDDK